MFNDQKVLIITPERLGDTLMCTPAIHYLKYYCPNIKLDVIALSPLSAETLQHNPAIDQVIILPSERWIQNQQYTAAINIHDGPLARRYFDLLTCPVQHLPSINPQLHQAEQALLFMQQLLPDKPPIVTRHYQLIHTAAQLNFVDKLLQTVNLKQDYLIGCQIGCHSIAKRWRKTRHNKTWPMASFQQLGEQLQQINPRYRLVFVGSKQEQRLGRQLQRQVPNSLNLVNQTSVGQLAALMTKFKVFIAPDSGIMHVACASYVPLIALMGPTNLQRTGPYAPLLPPIILQAQTMEEITIVRVLQAVLKVLRK